MSFPSIYIMLQVYTTYADEERVKKNKSTEPVTGFCGVIRNQAAATTPHILLVTLHHNRNVNRPGIIGNRITRADFGTNEKDMDIIIHDCLGPPEIVRQQVITCPRKGFSPYFFSLLYNIIIFLNTRIETKRLQRKPHRVQLLM